MLVLHPDISQILSNSCRIWLCFPQDINEQAWKMTTCHNFKRRSAADTVHDVRSSSATDVHTSGDYARQKWKWTTKLLIIKDVHFQQIFTISLSSHGASVLYKVLCYATFTVRCDILKLRFLAATHTMVMAICNIFVN